MCGAWRAACGRKGAIAPSKHLALRAGGCPISDLRVGYLSELVSGGVTVQQTRVLRVL